MFPWRAIYKDGVIEQYSGDQEVNFRVVAEGEMPIDFSIGGRFAVDLKTGVFFVDGRRVGDVAPMVKREPYQAKPIKLVYFRRTQVDLDLLHSLRRDTTVHFLGYTFEATLQGCPSMTGTALLRVTEDGQTTLCVGVDR